MRVLAPRVAVTLVVALALLGGACAPPALEDIEPASARLRNVQMLGATAIGGASAGVGEVEIEARDGARFFVPVRLVGGTVGSFFEMGTWGGDHLEIDLAKADAPTAAQLFGGYDGARYNLSLTVGVVWYDLENEHGVTLAGTGLAVSVGLFAGHEWLSLEPTAAPTELPPVPGSAADDGTADGAADAGAAAP